MKRIALATHAAAPSLTPSDALLRTALEAYGVAVEALPWDGPLTAFDGADLVVVRSTWNYHRSPAAFLDWIDRVGSSRIVNSRTILNWNINKRYLEQLAASGVRTPTAAFIEGGARQIAAAMDRLGLERAVVKPQISASSEGLFLVDRSDAEGIDNAARRIGRGVIVQEVIGEIAESGELSLIFIDGEYTHCVLKKPKAGEFRVQAEFGGSAVGYEPPAELVADARRVLEMVPDAPLYARIDGLALDGGLVLMEVELIEPELFFQFSEVAADRFAASLVRRLG
ncbi:MAG: hypothetical protein R3C60_00635 [Parvularculaceae bacterium]